VNPVALHAFNPTPMTGDGNWTWLLNGRVPTLVDAGVGDPRHLDAIEQSLHGIPLAQVIVTHGHGDHASGIVALARRMPGVTCRKWPLPERDARWQMSWTDVSNGDAIDAGDTQLIAVHTPGHAPDHVCLWHPDSRTLFGGDLAILGSTVYVPASGGGDLAAYLASLEKVLALDPVRILPAHGPTIENPSTLLRAYLRHRRQREAQIVAMMDERGHTSADAIARRVYAQIDPELLPRAIEMVRAHLIKLERDGRAARVGDEWRAI
jgi:glyoxylase-like metal-dependent hydrolase (beta-lactamase superfamily II)